MICPKDGHYCGDDMCQTSCLITQTAPLLKCEGGCGALVAADGSDYDACECEPECYDDDPAERS